jgi:hypothetical protein|tara:strand:+ start:4265 stop:4462 length:198 start_codon:yes stop_codon:yes gene_type:complete
MPLRPGEVDQIQEPIRIATEYLARQREQVINTILGPAKEQRIARIGDAPADEIIESIMAMMPGDM